MGSEGSGQQVIIQWNKVPVLIEEAFDASAISSVEGMCMEDTICFVVMDLIRILMTFMGTNLNPQWEKFLVPSEDDSIRCQHTSSPLGNGAIVETSDRKIIVLQRSTNVGEFPGHYVFPGGHPEPQEIGITSHQYVKDLTGSELINKKVSQEMFDSIIREVVEEIGVPASTLCNTVFLGISRRELNVRPTAFFSIKCSLESKEIQQLYLSAQDGYESTQLYAVSLSELENMTSKMPGCHQGGFALYKLMVESLKNT
ncbi:nudix hydrolase 9 isoform X3 [Quercus lobata]|uniref:nudix hydrolase 9 isoform X3 n=1 Tax=Quercus lobata TaxID=97700 RepID=UPI00124760BB|nr:nudix hydrolase 9 isoform X3 [Quercus lobata]